MKHVWFPHFYRAPGLGLLYSVAPARPLKFIACAQAKAKVKAKAKAEKESKGGGKGQKEQEPQQQKKGKGKGGSKETSHTERDFCSFDILNFGRVETVDMAIWFIWIFDIQLNFQILVSFSPQKVVCGP